MCIEVPAVLCGQMETVWLPQGSLNRILSQEDGHVGLASALAEMAHAPLGSPRHGNRRYVCMLHMCSFVGACTLHTCSMGRFVYI